MIESERMGQEKRIMNKYYHRYQRQNYEFCGIINCVLPGSFGNKGGKRKNGGKVSWEFGTIMKVLDG